MAKYVPGASPAERERKAGILFSGMAGTLAIARTLANEKDRDALLESARTFYLNATRG